MKSIYLTTFTLVSLLTPNYQVKPEPVVVIQTPVEAPKPAPEPPKPIKQYEPPVEDKESIQELIKAKSAEYGVDPIIPIVIVENESRYNPKAKGDKTYVCPITGEVAPSHGLAQINECWHPEVTLEQAQDPEFAVTFLVKAIAEGRCSEWSTCPIN